MRLSALILLSLSALSGCAREAATYTPCTSLSGEIRYRDGDGVETVYGFFGTDGLSQGLEWDDGDGATSTTYPPWYSDERGFFIDGLISIPPDYQTRAGWSAPGMQCRLQERVIRGQQVITCHFRDRDPLINRPNFLFSPARGITLIAYSPIVTGTETGEAYSYLRSPEHGLGAECVSPDGPD